MRTVMPELADQVDVKGECLIWTGGTNPDGYGVKRIKDKVSGTHRLNWEYANDQKIPKDMLILHTCDNPPCLLPSHLWLGTHEDNMRDMVDKGRTPRVEFCKRGHNMAEASYIRSNGYRQCRPCSVMDAQKTRDRKKLNK